MPSDISKREQRYDLIAIRQFGSGGFVEVYLNGILYLDTRNIEARMAYATAAATFRFDWWSF